MIMIIAVEHVPTLDRDRWADPHRRTVHDLCADHDLRAEHHAHTDKHRGADLLSHRGAESGTHHYPNDDCAHKSIHQTSYTSVDPASDQCTTHRTRYTHGT